MLVDEAVRCPLRCLNTITVPEILINFAFQVEADDLAGSLPPLLALKLVIQLINPFALLLKSSLYVS